MQGLAPKPCRPIDSLSAYAYVPEVPFHKSSLRTYSDRLLWVQALGVSTRQKVSEAGIGGTAVFRSEDESTFLPVPLLIHRCVALGGTYNPGIASTVPFLLW